MTTLTTVMSDDSSLYVIVPQRMYSSNSCVELGVDLRLLQAPESHDAVVKVEDVSLSLSAGRHVLPIQNVWVRVLEEFGPSFPELCLQLRPVQAVCYANNGDAAANSRSVGHKLL